MEASNKAVHNALMENMSMEQAKQIGQEAMINVLKTFRPKTVTLERGIENVKRIIETFVEKENEKNNIFTQEIEINNYPLAVRSRATNKDALNSVMEQTGCKVSVQGVYVEPGKRPPVG